MGAVVLPTKIRRWQATALIQFIGDLPGRRVIGQGNVFGARARERETERNRGLWEEDGVARMCIFVGETNVAGSLPLGGF